MQNQSSTDDLEHFYQAEDFTDAPIYPFGELWTNVPDTDTGWVHVHDHLELGRCVAGSGIFNIDGQIHRFHAPCCTIIYEGEWHSARSNPYDISTWNFLSIDLTSFLSGIDGKSIEAIKGINWQSYAFPSVMSAHSYPQIAGLIDDIFDESSVKRDASLNAIGGLLSALLIRHSRLMMPAERPALSSGTVERIAPALSFINGHYSENITVKLLADMCFISEASLRRYFTAFSGLSPLDYVQQTRIKNAAVMLLTTQKSILEIAYESGFPTASCFNRQFDKIYHMSPRDYRRSKRT